MASAGAIDRWSRDSLGTLCGFISIGASDSQRSLTSIGVWLVVFSPQMWECYKLKSADGLSIWFLLIWLVGDVTGLIGALLQGLAPTVVYLALYFTAADSILLFQYWWYQRRRRLHPELYEPHDASHITDPEQAPLLGAADHSGFGTLDRSKPKPRISQQTKEALSWTAAAFFVLAFAVAGWDAQLRGQSKAPRPRGPQDETFDVQAQIWGWISAALYLGARIPQILKNRHTKCLGLSLVFFFFSLAGNISYSASILLPSLEPQHLKVNAAWLVGSAGTLLLDFFVLGQFAAYRKERLALLREQ